MLIAKPYILYIFQASLLNTMQTFMFLPAVT